MKTSHNTTNTPELSRRDFFKLSSLAIATSLILPQRVEAKLNIADLFDIGEIRPQAKRLHIFNINTKKSLNIEFFENGKYIDDALQAIYKHMADKRSGEIAKIDKQLLNTLHKIQQITNSSKPIELISGFRSDETNKSMRKADRSVAKDSFHAQGMAADIYIPGVSLAELHRVALNLKAGGVGYYPKSNFIHVDVGPVRNWRG